MNLLWCQICTFYCPLKKNRFIILPKGTDVHIQQHIHQKDLNLCLHHVTMPRWLLGKNTNNKFSCVMVLIMRPSSTLKFQFVFGFNECLWEIFSLLNFEKFPVLYLGCGCIFMTFDFTTQIKLPLTPCQWIKYLSAKTVVCLAALWDNSLPSQAKSKKPFPCIPTFNNF